MAVMLCPGSWPAAVAAATHGQCSRLLWQHVDARRPAGPALVTGASMQSGRGWVKVPLQPPGCRVQGVDGVVRL